MKILIQEDREIKKAHKVYNDFTQNDEMIELYEAREKYKKDYNSMITGNRIFEEFKEALTEQFVLQQLIAENNIVPFYWSVDKGTAEIDFIIQQEDAILPN
jgi:hypothetical protein